MLMAPDSEHLSFPKNWPWNVKTAVIHVISPAHVAIIHTRGLLVNNANARIRLAGDLHGSLDEVSLLEEELRIKDAQSSRCNLRSRGLTDPRTDLVGGIS